MARLKKDIPKQVRLAQQRVDGMVSVDERLDLGNGVSVETVKAAIKRVTDGISEYNSLLAEADERSNDIDRDLKALVDLSARILSGTEFKFGRDSNEYEMVGGTRLSDRKKSGPKGPRGVK
ncbi:MAG: hypothetical protein JSS81_10945 [Acidobacteria bacterium]|nr:hypothetical protein [Acidobacteriota bacterium]